MGGLFIGDPRQEILLESASVAAQGADAGARRGRSVDEYFRAAARYGATQGVEVADDRAKLGRELRGRRASLRHAASDCVIAR